MTDKEILQKAISKSIDNGFRSILIKMDVFYSDWIIDEEGFIHDAIHDLHINSIIFNQDFAKSFWSCQDNISFVDSDIKELVVYEKQKCSWKEHLQQMVIEDEPLRYLEKFL